MITALVQFSLPAPLSVEQARAIFRGTAPRYVVRAVHEADIQA